MKKIRYIYWKPKEVLSCNDKPNHPPAQRRVNPGDVFDEIDRIFDESDCCWNTFFKIDDHEFFLGTRFFEYINARNIQDETSSSSAR